MKINTELIKKLKPCKDRFDNYLKYYESFDGNLKDFILLENITYNDKVWVFVRLATKMQSVKWSLLCASKVLSIFDEKYPNDDRPRKALEAVENYINNPCDKTANAAANAAVYASNAAVYASNAAANAAAYAAYAVANAAVYAANAAVYAANAARDIEEEVNLLFMIEAIN